MCILLDPSKNASNVFLNFDNSKLISLAIALEQEWNVLDDLYNPDHLGQFS